MITDFYDLFERFCIMTEEGNLPDSEVLKILEKRTDKILMEKLKKYLKKL